MKSARPLYLLIFPAFLIAFSALACLSTPLAISDIPVFPQATEIPPGTNDFADFLLENMQPITPTTTLSVVGKIYTVPCDTSWVVVQIFYEKLQQAAGQTNTLANRITRVNPSLAAQLPSLLGN